MGKHPCISWVPILWGRCRLDLTKKKPEDSTATPFDKESPKNLNNDVLYDLETDPCFLRTHPDGCRATPTIAVQSINKELDDKDIKLFLFDGKAQSVKSTRFDHSSWNAYYKGPIILWGSCDGFLLFKNLFGPTPFFCIWNPITKEQVMVTSPNYRSYMCGLYFHPVRKEYEVICVYYLGKKIWDFQILSLRTMHRRSVGSLSYPPSRKRSPVLIDGTLYWMVDCAFYLMENHVFPSLSESILSFNIETEKFATITSIEPVNDSPLSRRLPEDEFQLFDLDGKLGLFYPSSTEVVIWVLNYDFRNCTSECWIEIYSGTSPYDEHTCWIKRYSITHPDHKQSWNSYFREIEYIKMTGEFIAYDRWDRDKQPFIYNLHSGTWRLFEKKGFEGHKFTARVHTHSLVALDAADSVIRL